MEEHGEDSDRFATEILPVSAEGRNEERAHGAVRRPTRTGHRACSGRARYEPVERGCAGLVQPPTGLRPLQRTAVGHEK